MSYVKLNNLTSAEQLLYDARWAQGRRPINPQYAQEIGQAINDPDTEYVTAADEFGGSWIELDAELGQRFGDEVDGKARYELSMLVECERPPNRARAAKKVDAAPITALACRQYGWARLGDLVTMEQERNREARLEDEEKLEHFAEHFTAMCEVCYEAVYEDYALDLIDRHVTATPAAWEVQED